MKKVMLFAAFIFVFSSCSFETLQCHSYGNTNHKTSHGHKAQFKYTKKRI